MSPQLSRIDFGLARISLTSLVANAIIPLVADRILVWEQQNTILRNIILMNSQDVNSALLWESKQCSVVGQVALMVSTRI